MDRNGKKKWIAVSIALPLNVHVCNQPFKSHIWAFMLFACVLTKSHGLYMYPNIGVILNKLPDYDVASEHWLGKFHKKKTFTDPLLAQISSKCLWQLPPWQCQLLWSKRWDSASPMNQKLAKVLAILKGHQLRHQKKWCPSKCCAIQWTEVAKCFHILMCGRRPGIDIHRDPKRPGTWSHLLPDVERLREKTQPIADEPEAARRFQRLPCSIDRGRECPGELCT